MSTMFTCITPEDGWALYHHFFGNSVPTICIQVELLKGKKDESEDEKYRRRRIIEDVWAKLLGALYMIMRRMQLNGHNDVAAKMQQIVDIVVEQDLTNFIVLDAIRAKLSELTSQRDFEETVERLQAENT